MSLNRRQFNRALLATLVTGVLPIAQAAGKNPHPRTAKAPAVALIEGQDWVAIVPPQPAENPGKIEVLEFFSYGCPHCKDFNPLVKRWAEKLPRDVSFRRIPITFDRAAWVNLARLFYTLEATGDLARLDQAVFEAIHVQRTNLYTEKAAREWAVARHVNEKKFSDAFASFSVESRVARAIQLARAYKVQGVPMITVDGRYIVLGQAAKGLPDLLVLAEELIKQARFHRKK